MRVAILVAILAVALAGCGQSQMAGSLFYLKPYNIDSMTCDELNRQAKAAADRTKALAALREKAGTDTGGSTIGAVVFAPDSNRAMWDAQMFENEAARRNCPPPEPPKP